ncbi:MAG: hypothetical protein ACLTWO_05740 [Blautia massiliensis (ex Durand et al. 2017)]
MQKQIVCQSCGRIFIGYHNSKFCENCCQKRAKAASAETWARTKQLRVEQRNKSVIVTYDSDGSLFFASEKENYRDNLKAEAKKLQQSSKQWAFPESMQEQLNNAVENNEELPVLKVYSENEPGIYNTIYSKRIRLGDFLFKEKEKKKRGRKRKTPKKYATKRRTKVE